MRPTLLYSGGCPFCRWVARNIVLRLDKFNQLDIIPFRDATASWLLRGIPDAERYQTWWFIDGNGKRWRGNRGGGIALLLTLKRTHWIGCVLCRLGLGVCIDKLDCWVKAKRPILSKLAKTEEEIKRIRNEE